MSDDPRDWRSIPCKLWDGPKDKSGYGRSGKKGRVHRTAWEDVHGPIPNGMHVCHHCDVRNCYEVEHLFIGTPWDNVLDMMAKGRGRNDLCDRHTAKDFCPRGHLYDYETPDGWRRCRACDAASKERQRLRREARPAKPNRQLSFRIDPELHDQLRLLAARNALPLGRTVSDVLRQHVEREFAAAGSSTPKLDGA